MARVYILFFSVFFVFPLFSEDAARDVEPSDAPVPYEDTEFSLWQKELYRFEALSIGAFPIVTLLSFITYDIIRLIQQWSTKPPTWWALIIPGAELPPLSTKERAIVFGVAVGISVTIGLIDVTYRAVKRAIHRRSLERSQLVPDPIELVPLDSFVEGTDDST
ncbi:hypothetical protein [Treponema pallidum]|uniref:Uncharacterized protein TP_0338 n=5 Tax=Treponema pallidum TaxID=160 RepID=Y338_TREPA|nr:hypothetical protein [Treponema pallidum]O83358.1 RecName: Full=Uncharacterized protein TP_0338; Flags: Precursor [Treponema pallidum subsp. pallidum str. Nichols]AAC65329.1 predicted coding region TP0338 [Treponema pallidum subsp. pallidum str. Nichols]ACD70764.1 hypothetical protein TPASS_0338 [Treponema pallidum subsp. pallidum SS14]ADD72463.1 conserved hypothetical protein [Treponema pallidum subsp. pallidum str. Chicago]AEZ57453.1 putative membrane protein [Treponema pallidum subsp. pe